MGKGKERSVRAKRSGFSRRRGGILAAFYLAGFLITAAPGGVRAASPSDSGSKEVKSSIEAALDWLVRHQSPDGRWSSHDFVTMCDKETGPCRNAPWNKAPWGRDDGRGWKGHDIGVTALAILAFTGWGHTHQSGRRREYVSTVQKAVDFLKRVQISGTGNPDYDGCFRFKSTLPPEGMPKNKIRDLDEKVEWMYDHAVATMAMAEVLFLSGDREGLGSCVERAAEFCLHARKKGAGWRYSVKSVVSDTSVTGWMVGALSAVRTCRIMGLVSAPGERELDGSLKDALKWIDFVTERSTGAVGYMSPGDQGSILVEISRVRGGYPYDKKIPVMTAVGLSCRYCGGRKSSAPVMRKGMKLLMNHLPLWRTREGKKKSTISFLYWYFGSLAAFHRGGRDWQRWHTALRKALIPTQRKKGDVKGRGCEAGSWDPIGEWGIAGGRVYSTALGALALEVYFRWKRAQEFEREK